MQIVLVRLLGGQNAAVSSLTTSASGSKVHFSPGSPLNKFAQTQTRVHTHIYTRIHTSLHACTDARTYTHTHIHAYIHTHVHAYIHTYIHTYTHIHTYIQMHIHTYMHTYIHACVHTYTHACMLACTRASPAAPAPSKLCSLVFLQCLHVAMKSMLSHVTHPTFDKGFEAKWKDGVRSSSSFEAFHSSKGDQIHRKVLEMLGCLISWPFCRPAMSLPRASPAIVAG